MDPCNAVPYGEVKELQLDGKKGRGLELDATRIQLKLSFRYQPHHHLRASNSKRTSTIASRPSPLQRLQTKTTKMPPAPPKVPPPGSIPPKPQSIPPNQTLYVRGIPSAHVKKDDLRTALYMLFSTYGPVLDVVALRTSKMRGQAHIVYRDIQTATQAMRALDGFDFLGQQMVSPRRVRHPC